MTRKFDPETPRDASLPPGFDETDPYKGEDIKTYPEWWQENIQEFEKHNMRPYRPPQFLNGEPVPETISELEEEYAIDIRIRNESPKEGQKWGIWIDGEFVSDIDRHRDGDGYTEYHLNQHEFRTLVQKKLETD